MSTQAFRISEEYWCSRSRLLAFLDETTRTACYKRTTYLTSEQLAICKSVGPSSVLDCVPEGLADVLGEIENTDTGLVVFMSARGEAIAVTPPFPIKIGRSAEGFEIAPLVDLLNSHPVVAVLLLRLGRYALGVIKGEELIASKTANRYVKRRHRAGGASQRRFERSRERLVRELFDKTCSVATDLFSQCSDRIDYIFFGGERHTLRSFVKRCRYLREYEDRILSRILKVDTPNQASLERISYEIWKSKVVVFASGQL